MSDFFLIFLSGWNSFGYRLGMWYTHTWGHAMRITHYSYSNWTRTMEFYSAWIRVVYDRSVCCVFTEIHSIFVIRILAARDLSMSQKNVALWFNIMMVSHMHMLGACDLLDFKRLVCKRSYNLFTSIIRLICRLNIDVENVQDDDVFDLESLKMPILHYIRPNIRGFILKIWIAHIGLDY